MDLTLWPLMDDQKCFETVRCLRWPGGVACPHCESMAVTKRGMDETQACRQRYHCGGCGRDFDDLTGTVFAGHHLPLRVWLLCLYFRGLNLSNRQIARELSLDEDSTHDMASQLREGIVARQPTVVDGQVCIAPFGQATVDIVLVGIDRGVGAMVDLISGPMVTCLTFSSIRMTTIPPR